MEISIPDSPHFRNFVAILFGMVVGVIVVGTIESMGNTIYPPPVELDLGDIEQLKEYIATEPAGAMSFVLIAWSLGIFSGCLVSGIMGVKQGVLCCSVYSLIFMVVVIIILRQISYPIWFSIAGISLLVPSAFAGWAASRSILIRLGAIPRKEPKTDNSQ